MRLILVGLLTFVTTFYGHSTPIHFSAAVSINGINQWIKADGVSDENPMLLFLHGGPGGSVMGYADRFSNELKNHFIVIQWDQRETGKTKLLNHSDIPLTVALFEADVVAVIHYLQEKFHQEKIYLVGHSWGGFLALYVAARNPALIGACVAASPMVYQEESERMTLAKMKQLAADENNSEATRELAAIKIPFENGTQLYYQRKWLYRLINRQKPPFTQHYVEDWSATWLSLFNEASAISFFESAPEIKCPVYFLAGAHDYQTNFNLTKSYFEKVKAEKKELFWFSNSAHGLNLTESKKFQNTIIQIRNQK
jgi:pimeloyl-ACP methyl ester carboxylesterase